MSIGSPFYIASIFFLIAVTAALYYFLRHKSRKVQRILLLSLMLLNTAQHFLKPVIYPQYWGDGFSIHLTAYNMCAVLIIFMPVAFLLNNRFLKNYFFFVGSVAGLIAIVIPFWFLGLPVSALGWEYARFYLCHALLHLSAVLPLLLGHHRPVYREFWQIGLGFLIALCVVFFNNVIFILLGFCPGIDSGNLYAGLIKYGACAMMGPPASMSWLGTIARFFTLPMFVGENPADRYAPILWYAVPLYLGITALTAAAFAVMKKMGFTKK